MGFWGCPNLRHPKCETFYISRPYIATVFLLVGYAKWKQLTRRIGRSQPLRKAKRFRYILKS